MMEITGRNNSTEIVPSATQSPMPAFVLMLQYLLHQQHNATHQTCKKYMEDINKLHEEKLRLESEREKLHSLISMLQDQYSTMERRLRALESKNKVDKQQKFAQLQSSNVTIKDKISTFDEVGDNNETNNNLHKFFEEYFKKDNSECTKDRALQLAVRMNDSMVTDALLKAGTDVDTEDAMSWQRTPLHWAAVLNYPDITHILINGGANVESRETGVYSLYTPLHEAAKYGHLLISSILLDAEANPNSKDRDGSTPLHIAARNGRFEVAQLLVQRGATIAEKDYWGLTPKDRAKKYSHSEVADWLSKTEKLPVPDKKHIQNVE